jgi:hypothetical protein
MDTLWDAEEINNLKKRQRTALQQLLHRLPRSDMLEFGKVCFTTCIAAKAVHEERVVQAFSKFLYSDTQPIAGQLRTGLVRMTNAVTAEPNVFYPHQIKGAIDVVGTDVELEWDDRNVTKFLFWGRPR